jgi:A/G-specific adenine glycosylase
LGIADSLPVKRRKKALPHFDVAAGVIYKNGDRKQFLIAQRPAEGMLGGLWEFPGGKQEPGETLPETLARELMEELAIEVAVGEKLTEVKHAFTHFRITLHAFHARHLAGEPQRIGVDDWRWVTLDELDAFAFAKTDRQIIAALKEPK